MSWIFVCILTLSLCLYTQAHKSNAAVELQSYNYPDYYIQPANTVSGGAVTIQRSAKPATWKVISPGLCNARGTVSFRIGSQNFNIYLRNRNGLVNAENFDHSSSFADSACFYIRYNKWFPRHVAIESFKSPGYFLRHQHSRIKFHPYRSTTLFEKDASYIALFSQSANDSSHIQLPR